MACDQARQFIGPPLKGSAVLHHFIQQAKATRFLGFDQARGKNDLLEPRCPDQGRESADIGRRQAVAERARDRKSEFRCPGSNAKVTARGDPGAAAGANAVDRCNRRHLALFERAQHAIDPCLVVDGILRGVECAKLIDVGAGREGLVARAGEDQHLEGAIAGRGFADRGKPLIHVEGQRISGLRPVENDPADAVADLVKQVCTGGRVFIHFVDRPLRMEPQFGRRSHF